MVIGVNLSQKAYSTVILPHTPDAPLQRFAHPAAGETPVPAVAPLKKGDFDSSSPLF